MSAPRRQNILLSIARSLLSRSTAQPPPFSGSTQSRYVLLAAQPVAILSFEISDGAVAPCCSDSAVATAASVAAYLRCGSASDRHSSITLSSVAGLKGLRRHLRRTEAERHFQASQIFGFRAGKGVTGDRDQRDRRRALVKYPDRLETAHVRHEDIDDHQVERRVVERREAVGPAVRDRDPETAPLEPGAYRKAGMKVVIDNQNATHDGLLRRVKRAATD